MTGLAVSGGRLVSGSDDGTLGVWRLAGPPDAWVRERTLGGGAGRVWRVAAWAATKAAVGMADGVVRVWDAVSGTPERALGLPRPGGPVVALLARGPRLTASWADGVVRAWSVDGGACLATAEGEGAFFAAQSLAGRWGAVAGGTERGRLRLWSAGALVPAAGRRVGRTRSCVHALVVEGGELWGCVGRELVVWGRTDAPDEDGGAP